MLPAVVYIDRHHHQPYIEPDRSQSARKVDVSCKVEPHNANDDDGLTKLAAGLGAHKKVNSDG